MENRKQKAKNKKTRRREEKTQMSEGVEIFEKLDNKCSGTKKQKSESNIL